MQIKQIITLAPVFALAMAAPLKAKRDLVYHTVIDEVVVTEVLTTTIWVDGSVPTPVAQPTVTPEASPSPSPVASSPDTVKPSPAGPPVVSPVFSSSSSTSGLAAIQKPTPTPTPTTTSTPVSSSTSSSVSSSSSAASSPAGSFPVETLEGASSPDGPCTSGQLCTGDMTYYSPSQGVGACGYKDWATSSIYTDNDMVVAIPHQIFGSITNGGTPDSVNTLCNRSVQIYNPHSGKTQTAKVVDKCAGCLNAYDLDMSPTLFQALGGGDGRVHGIQWFWTE